VLVNRVRREKTRQLGGCVLGLELWKRLERDGFFEQIMDEEAAEVPWSRVAAVLAINRLCAPGSELAIRLDDLFTGSGAIRRAWIRFTGRESDLAAPIRRKRRMSFVNPEAAPKAILP
jgi:hypothetical protein